MISAALPEARAGEGAFAASGTCLVALPGTRRAWFGTGGRGGGRVFRTEDGGKTWTLVPDGPRGYRPAIAGEMLSVIQIQA